MSPLHHVVSMKMFSCRAFCQMSKTVAVQQPFSDATRYTKELANKYLNMYFDEDKAPLGAWVAFVFVLVIVCCFLV